MVPAVRGNGYASAEERHERVFCVGGCTIYEAGRVPDVEPPVYVFRVQLERTPVVGILFTRADLSAASFVEEMGKGMIDVLGRVADMLDSKPPINVN